MGGECHGRALPPDAVRPCMAGHSTDWCKRMSWPGIVLAAVKQCMAVQTTGCCPRMSCHAYWLQLIPSHPESSILLSVGSFMPVPACSTTYSFRQERTGWYNRYGYTVQCGKPLGLFQELFRGGQQICLASPTLRTNGLASEILPTTGQICNFDMSWALPAPPSSPG